MSEPDTSPIEPKKVRHRRRRRVRRVSKPKEDQSKSQPLSDPSLSVHKRRRVVRDTRKRHIIKSVNDEPEPPTDKRELISSENTRIETIKKPSTEEVSERTEEVISESKSETLVLETLLYERKPLTVTSFDIGSGLYLTKKTEERPVFQGVINSLKRDVLHLEILSSKYPDNSLLQNNVVKYQKECEVKESQLRGFHHVDLEEEGLYFGDSPYLCEYIEYIQTQRYLRSSTLLPFFHPTGALKILSDPLSQDKYRPNDLFDFFGEASLTRPTVPFKFINTSYKFFQVDVSLHRLTFFSHPFMNEESYYCRKLFSVYREYRKGLTSKKATGYRQKIKSLLRELQKLRAKYSMLNKPTRVLALSKLSPENDISMTLGYRMARIRNELRRIREVCESEVRESIMLVNEIIGIWRNVKIVREKTGVCSVGVKVEFESIRVNKERQIEVIKRQIRDELIEMEEDRAWLFKKKTREYHNNVLKGKKKMTKPILQKLDRKKEREIIKNRILKNTAKPGEMLIKPVLKKIEISNTNQVSTEERIRRKKLAKLSYFVKLLFNGKEVARTKNIKLEQDFSLSINEIIPVSVLKWPQSISLQIRQKKGILGSNLIASVAIPTRTLEKDDEKKYDNIKFKGSNPFTVPYDKNRDEKHYENGNIRMNVEWVSVRDDEEPKAPPVPKSEEQKLLKNSHLPTARDIMDMEKMKKWMKDNSIDLNDPKNTSLLSMFEVIENKNKNRKGFYLTEQTDSLFFREDYRYKEKIERIKDNDDDDDRSSRVDFVEKYVIEPQLPKNIFKFFSLLWNIFSPRRPLNPERKVRIREVKSVSRDCKIYIQIIRAHNIPLRSFDSDSYTEYRKQKLEGFAKETTKREDEDRAKTQKEDDDKSDSDVEDAYYKRTEIELDDFKKPKDTVVSFVEVFFQKTSSRTSSIEGEFPQFNESLELPFIMDNNDYSPDSVKLYNETIYFDFFDKVSISTMKDERHIDIEKRRTEKRWLGSFGLPFSTLYQNGQICGTFKVNTPEINLGYNYKEKTTFTVNITLDPPIPLPLDIQDIQSSGESPDLTMYCQWWIRTKKKFSRTKNRYIIALAPNLFGKGTLICRYISLQEPPYGLNTEFELLRFVSLITFSEDIITFKERTEVWTDSQHFLDQGGDYEEHAILLCNFFLSMGKKAWVLLGKAIPEGETAYVLTLGKNDRYLLWNASSGEVYSENDSECPLKSVGCVFNNENVWANIQLENIPYLMKFNLEDKNCWEPMFTPNNQKMFNIKVSIQKPLVYTEKNEDDAMRLENEIMREVRLGITKKRVTYAPFKFHIESDLRQILIELEKAKSDHQEFKPQRQLSILRDVAKNMIGYPLNFKSSDIKDIVKQILNTKIHKIGEGETNVAFATAVYVKRKCVFLFSLLIFSVSM